MNGQVDRRVERGAAGHQLEGDPAICTRGRDRACRQRVRAAEVGTGIDDIEDASYAGDSARAVNVLAPDSCGLAIPIPALDGDGVSTRGCCRSGLWGGRSVVHRAVEVGDEAPRVRSENPVQGFRAVMGNVDADLQIPIGVVT